MAAGSSAARPAGQGRGLQVTGGLGTNNNLDGILVDPVTHVAWGWRSSDGVWVLAPGATTWSQASVGLPSTSVVGLALDGSGSRRMIAATTSGMASLPAAGGPSWTPVNGGLTGLETYATALTHDGGGAAYLESLNFHMWRLAPGATTWTQVAAAGMPAPFAELGGLVGDPTQAGRVLALTASSFAPNLGLGPAWRTTDGGASFTRAGAGIRAAQVRAVAADPRHAGRVLVGTEDDAVQRSQDSGGTWAPGATGLPDTAVRALGADGVDDGTWYAAPGGGAGVYRSTDNGATWAAVGTGDPDNPSVLATIPGRAGVVFVADGGSVYKSTNHGDTWTPLPALPGSVTSLVPDLAQAGAIWATAGNGGIWHIAEGEAAWTERDTGLGGLYVDSLAVDPHVPTRLFASISNAGVYRSINGGLNWSPMSSGIPESYINALAVDPQLADTVYAATQSGVYRSADAGASWTPLTGGTTLPRGRLARLRRRRPHALRRDAGDRRGRAHARPARPSRQRSAARRVAGDQRYASPRPQAHRDERDLGRRARSGTHARLAALHVRELVQGDRRERIVVHPHDRRRRAAHSRTRDGDQPERHRDGGLDA